LTCDIDTHLRTKGHEFGATTGRNRRTGWFDAIAVRYAIQINSISGLCLTKLDVLDGLETVKICVGYHNAAGESVPIPFDAQGWDDVVPVYEDTPGWKESTIGAKTMVELPANALAYIKRLETLVGIPIDIISTGPDRVETIVLRSPFG
jgi:adenylosuccinate synthase